jgi:hypothetical protein
VLNTRVDGPPRDFPFEAIDECWFPSIEVAARALAAPAVRPLNDNLAKARDTERNITMLARPTHRWPKEPKR